MTRLDLFRRVITAAVLVALAVTLGVWLTRAPLTAAPVPPPVKPAEAIPEPTLAPVLPLKALSAVAPITIEVPIEVEIAASAPGAADPLPTVEAAEPTPKARSPYWPNRRGLFRRR